MNDQVMVLDTEDSFLLPMEKARSKLVLDRDNTSIKYIQHKMHPHHRCIHIYGYLNSPLLEIAYRNSMHLN